MIVTLSIKDTRSGEERTVEVGEFRAMMEKGFTIGNADDCKVKLACDPPVKVRVWGSGNTRLLEVLEGQMPFGDKVMKAGVGLPAQSGVAWDGKLQQKFQKEVRVDRYPFQLPPFELKLGEK
jgi:hypothetical protein